MSDLLETDPEKYVASFKSLAIGEGRLWITDSRVTHSDGINGKEHGAVEWIRFSVEIKLRNRIRLAHPISRHPHWAV